MKKYIIQTILYSIITISAFAQDRSYFYTNTLNPFLSNPALAGSQDQIQAIFNARSYISGIEGSPRMFNFGLNAPVLNRTAGLGVKIISDQQGIFQTTNAEAAYSKLVKINDANQISFGLSIGFIQTRFRTELMNSLVDFSDQSLVSPDLNKINFASGAGMYYKFKNAFDLGVSFPMLATGSNKLNEMMVASAGYNFYTGKDLEWKIRPLVNYFNLPASPNMADIGVMGEWNQTLRLQTMYRSNSAIIFTAGFNVKYVGLNYSYYMHTSTLKNLAPAQNEIAILFRFNAPASKKVNSVAGNEPQVIQDELDKINSRMSGLISVEKTNPGLVNMKKELERLTKDLDRILSKYKINNPEQIKRVRELQDSIDAIIAKYSN